MKKYFAIVLLFSFLMGGCEILTQRKPDFPDLKTEESLKSVQKEIKESTSSVKKSTDNIQEQVVDINKNTEGIKADVTHEDRHLIFPHLTAIESDASAILAHTKNINSCIDRISSTGIIVGEASRDVNLLQQALVVAQKDNESLIKERDQAIADKDSIIQKMLTYLIIGSIVGSVGFMAAFFIFGNKMGMFGALVCACVLVVSIFVQAYFQYIAIAGGVIFVLLIVALFASIIRYKKALKEVVNTVEVAKDNMPAEERSRIFGDKNNDGVLDIIQSPSTEALVKNIKDNFPSLWKYVKKYKHDEDIS